MSATTQKEYRERKKRQRQNHIEALEKKFQQIKEEFPNSWLFVEAMQLHLDNLK